VTALVLSALGAALIGGGHCASMCGAFACAAADVSRDFPAKLRASAAYHVARLAAYASLGAVAGSLGANVDATLAIRGFVRPAALFGGSLLVLWGIARLLAAFGVPVPRIRAPRFMGAVTSRLLRSAAPLSATMRAAVLGALAPLLPCGWLYAFVASAGATGSAATGTLVMVGFWAGTVPALAAVALGLHRLLGPARRLIPLATAIALIFVGSMTVMRAVRADAVQMEHAHGRAP